MSVMLSIPMLMFLIATIALPNTFFKAEYNFPLLLLACLMWPKQELRQTIVYLILLSWMADMYFILRYTSQEEKSEMVLVLSIVLLVSKVLLVVWIIVSDETLRRRLTCMGVVKSLASVGNNSDDNRDDNGDDKEDQT